MLNYCKEDINWKLAHDAHYGTSFSPERRADGVVTEYMAEMKAMVDEFSQYVTEENSGELATDLEMYRVGYIARLNVYLQAHSRVMSTMITGPANFPVRSNEKKSDTADRRRDEWLAWRKKTIELLRRKWNPVARANAPISADDDQAMEKLLAKIERAEKDQAVMKAANAVVRNRNLDDAGKITELVKLGITESVARELLRPDYAGRRGYADFQLTNNNANIRRMRARVEQLQQEQARPEQAEQEIAGVKIIENKEINRLQLIFPGKPAPAVIAALKSHGFHWSPREGAWQRQLNESGRQASKKVLAGVA